MDATTAISVVLDDLAGEPVFLAGSLVAADEYGKPHAWDDADVFCPSGLSLMAALQRLIDHPDYELDDRGQRILSRWKAFGFNFHTNSIKIENVLHKFDVNLVYKTAGKNSVNSLSQVLESFDFGLLGVGYEVRNGSRHDLRSFLFPDISAVSTAPLPLIGQRHDAWANGLISEYQRDRQFGRWAKYEERGYDLSRITPVLISGYNILGEYYADRDHKGDDQRSAICAHIVEGIQNRDLQALMTASKLIPTLDTLDEIIAALE